MNKTELIDAMATNAGISKVVARKALDGFIKSVSQALRKGDKVALSGFGAFSVSERASRVGVNPSTMETMTIEAKNVVKFKAGAELSDRVNKKQNRGNYISLLNSNEIIIQKKSRIVMRLFSFIGG